MTSVGITALVVDGITEPIETSIDNLLADDQAVVVFDMSRTPNEELHNEPDVTYVHVGRQSLLAICKKAEKLAAEMANLLDIQFLTLLLLESEDSYEFPKGEFTTTMKAFEHGLPVVIKYTDPFGEVTQTGIVNRLRSEVFWSRYGYTTKLDAGFPQYSLDRADTLESVRIPIQKVVLQNV